MLAESDEILDRLCRCASEDSEGVRRLVLSFACFISGSTLARCARR